MIRMTEVHLLSRLKVQMLLLASVCATWSAVAAQVESTDRTVKPPTSTGEFVFSLLPKSFNKNAKVDMTVFGEVTEAGKAMPLPTPQQPVLYIAQSGGFRPDRLAPLGERAPATAVIDAHVKKAMTAAGYTLAAESQTPHIAVAYTWGSLYRSTDILTRASIVGGPKFAKEIAVVLGKQREYAENAEDMRRIHTPVFMRGSREFAAGGMYDNISNRSTFAGDYRYVNGSATRGRAIPRASIPLFDFDAFNPEETYKRQDWNNATLLEQVRGELYYVVISAYDQPALARGERVLLWRTRLTVDASGVSMVDTLPVLLTNSSAYLGKETGRPGTLLKPVQRTTKIEFGNAEVKEYMDPGPAAAPEKKDK